MTQHPTSIAGRIGRLDGGRGAGPGQGAGAAHGPADHFGGSAYFQQKFGSKVYVSAADWTLMETPPRGRGPGPGAPPPASPPKRNGELRDGESVTLEVRLSAFGIGISALALFLVGGLYIVSGTLLATLRTHIKAADYLGLGWMGVGFTISVLTRPRRTLHRRCSWVPASRTLAHTLAPVLGSRSLRALRTLRTLSRACRRGTRPTRVCRGRPTHCSPRLPMSPLSCPR